MGLFTAPVQKNARNALWRRLDNIADAVAKAPKLKHTDQLNPISALKLANGWFGDFRHRRKPTRNPWKTKGNRPGWALAKAGNRMNPSGITPLDVKVLVKPDPVEEKTAGGIILADTTKEKSKYAATKGTLIAVGPNAFAEWGAEAAPKQGARVLHAQYAGSRFKGDDGEDYIVMNDEDIIGQAE